MVTTCFHGAIPPAFLYTGICGTIRSAVVLSFDGCPGLTSTATTATALAFAGPGHNGFIRFRTRAPFMLAAVIPIPVPIRPTLDRSALARRMRGRPLPGEHHLRRCRGSRGTVRARGDAHGAEWAQIGVHVARCRGRKREGRCARGAAPS